GAGRGQALRVPGGRAGRASFRRRPRPLAGARRPARRRRRAPGRREAARTLLTGTAGRASALACRDGAHRRVWSLRRDLVMRRASLPLAAAALVALAAPSALAASHSLPPPDAAAQARAGPGDYRIGPGDVLNINVDQAAELSKTFEVDTSGRLLLPLVGEIPAAGRTPAELSDDIAVALKKKYMKNPQVLVSLKEAQGQRVTVDGAVN